MPDINKTIKDLEECLSASCRGYKPKVYCPHRDEEWDIMRDALELLKEQQPKETSWIHRKDMDFKDKLGCNHIHGMCENCGLICDFKDGHTAQYKYCPQCGGKAVQWKDGEQE